MNFQTPLSGGLLIVGSLFWDKHETRILLRETLQNSIALNRVAVSIISAEHKENVSFSRFNWGWGCLALLPNPNKADKHSVKQLAEFWDTKFSNGFEPLNYVVPNEEPLVTKQGQLLLDWKDEYGDLDFVVLTATKPTLPIPTPIILSESFEINDSYFIGNGNNNIQTYQDEDILYLLNAAHEEKP